MARNKYHLHDISSGRFREGTEPVPAPIWVTDWCRHSHSC